MTNPVNADQLRVTVEMGDGYEPSERLAAALTELGQALSDAESDVAGFGRALIRSFVYDSRSWVSGHGDELTENLSLNFQKFEG